MPGEAEPLTTLTGSHPQSMTNSVTQQPSHPDKSHVKSLRYVGAKNLKNSLEKVLQHTKICIQRSDQGKLKQECEVSSKKQRKTSGIAHPDHQHQRSRPPLHPNPSSPANKERCFVTQDPWSQRAGPPVEWSQREEGSPWGYSEPAKSQGALLPTKTPGPSDTQLPLEGTRRTRPT